MKSQSPAECQSVKIVNELTYSLTISVNLFILEILGQEEMPRERNNKMMKKKRCYLCSTKNDKKMFYCCVQYGKPIYEDHLLSLLIKNII